MTASLRGANINTSYNEPRHTRAAQADTAIMTNPTPKITPVAARLATRDAWDRIVAESDEATFFHTRAWTEAAALAPSMKFPRRKGRPVAWHVRFEDGVEAVLSAVLFRWVRAAPVYAESGAGSAYGGWIATAGFTPRHEDAAWRSLPWKNIEVRRNPFSSRASHARSAMTVYEEKTAALDLTPGYDAIEAGWTRGKSQVWINARRGEKAGIKVIRATTEEEWTTFHEVYVANSARWQNPQLHPLDMLLRLRKIAPENAHLWLGLADDRIVAGELALVHRRHMAGLIRAALPEGYKKNAAAWIDVNTVRHYAASGVRWFDMDSSGDNEGARRHKLSFGAEELDASLDLHRSRAYCRARNLWRRCAHAGIGSGVQAGFAAIHFAGAG